MGWHRLGLINEPHGPDRRVTVAIECVESDLGEARRAKAAPNLIGSIAALPTPRPEHGSAGATHGRSRRDSASDVSITDVAEDPNQHDDVGRHGAGVGSGISGVGEPYVDPDARVQACGLLPGSRREHRVDFEQGDVDVLHVRMQRQYAEDVATVARACSEHPYWAGVFANRPRYPRPDHRKAPRPRRLWIVVRLVPGDIVAQPV